jgi:hypothetical protein
MALLDFRAGHLEPARDDLMNRYQTREDYLAALERERRMAIGRRRLYYDGSQYDENNAECLRGLSGISGGGDKQVARAIALWRRELPEHERLHEYSMQIAETVDFMAARLTSKASVTCEDTAVQELVDRVLDATPELRSTDDDEELTLLNPVREAMKAGDTAVLMRWDPQRGCAWWEFWDGDLVELRFVEPRNDEVDKAIVEEVDWMVPPGEEVERAVRIRRTWEVQPRPTIAGEPVDIGPEPVPEKLLAEVDGVRRECVETVEIVDGHGQDKPVLVARIGWGVPFVPWWPVRADRKNLRAVRGESLITDQAMKTADRYNAVEQVAYLISRYNSHSNIAVTGDTATAMMANAQRVSKDVADMILLPGSNGATVLSLPTDPAMIEHQKEVLLDALYGIMGVTRVDQSSLTGLGQVTGYALEILNQKTDNTFTRVRNQLTADLKRLINLTLDATAYWQLQASTVEAGLLEVVGEEEAGQGLPVGYDSVDPKVVFPNRAMTVEFGSGYVVDEAKLRDDFTANLVSQEYVLRKKGLSKPEIDEMMGEQDAASQKKLERQAQQQALVFGQTGTESGSFGKRSTSAGGAGSSTQSPRTASTRRAS